MSRNGNFKIYLARPISGCLYSDVEQYYTELTGILEDVGYMVLNPMTGKGSLKEILKDEPFKSTGYIIPQATNNAILKRDEWMVSLADVVYVNLVGAKEKSIGCICEISFAHIIGKYIVLAMEPGNIHNHAFVNSMAGAIFPNTVDAETYLIDLIQGNM